MTREDERRAYWEAKVPSDWDLIPLKDVHRVINRGQSRELFTLKWLQRRAAAGHMGAMGGRETRLGWYRVRRGDLIEFLVGLDVTLAPGAEEEVPPRAARQKRRRKRRHGRRRQKQQWSQMSLLDDGAGAAGKSGARVAAEVHEPPAVVARAVGARVPLEQSQMSLLDDGAGAAGKSGEARQ
ncbi:MAG TPA: hypothetical protein VGC13_22385 [Longimicrobium sp.]|jgi:hypothetical protein|uniref:hypothetical protein n=1 Tax=Longimicrobium sp. TaxID=2029185 RepID=UPI002ED88BC4